MHACVADGEGVAAVLSDLQHVRSRLVVALKAEKVSAHEHRGWNQTHADAR